MITNINNNLNYFTFLLHNKIKVPNLFLKNSDYICPFNP